MGRLARGAKSRWTRAARYAIALACTAIVLALPAAALANDPAQRQYVTPNVTASGSGHDRGNADSAVPAASSSGGSGNAALQILLGGIVVIGGAGALILYRRRPSNPSSPE